MSLKSHFEEIINAKLNGIENELHLLIIGSAHTGKTDAAFEYADMLKKSGAVTGDFIYIDAQKTTHILQRSTDKGFADMEAAFRTAAGGTIIFDAGSDNTPTSNLDACLLSRLTTAIDTENTTVIAVGDNSFFEKINQDPALARRMDCYMLSTEKNAAPKIVPRSSNP
jgi:hypothetical protein